MKLLTIKIAFILLILSNCFLRKHKKNEFASHLINNLSELKKHNSSKFCDQLITIKELLNDIDNKKIKSYRRAYYLQLLLVFIHFESFYTSCLNEGTINDNFRKELEVDLLN